MESTDNKNKRDDRIGMSMMMNCGMRATIINYRTCNDIDVQFKDGIIVKHKKFKCFQKGEIMNPNLWKNRREGMSLMMNCGMKATITKYSKAHDINIQFEDGTIIKHQNFRKFQNGQIAYPNLWKNRREGMSLMMNCGMKATIINYRNTSDIDVQFEDGYIIRHTTYYAFSNRAVNNPKAYGIPGISRNEYALQYILKPYGFKKSEKGSLKSLGLGRLELDLYNPNLNGHRIAIEYDGYFTCNRYGHTKNKDLKKNKKCYNANITLIRIREPQLCELNSTSIDYKLNSSAIMSQDFLNIINQIINFLNKNFKAKIPTVKEIPKDDILLNFAHECYGYNHSNRVGMTLMMNCGMKAKIIKYENSMDIDVQFEDGTIVKHKGFGAFQKGGISNPNLLKNKREGTSLKMNCGMRATIINYSNCNDINVQFEDGTIVKHKTFRCFQKGGIDNPNISIKNKRNGMTLTMNCGMKATIIEYRNSCDIDIQFEDGTIVKNKEFKSFQKGEIMNTNISIKDKRIGTSLMMNCGMRATIIEYRNSCDIDIQFEDGTIVRHKTFRNYGNGAISNPNISIIRTNSLKDKRKGMSKKMHCGMKATIIKYRNTSDIDVQFEDGTIVKHKGFGAFQKRNIKNPNVSIKDKRIGTSLMMNCGMRATIIEYRNSCDIDIQFEDGTCIKHKRFENFQRGKIMNPNISMVKTNPLKDERKGMSLMMNCGMEAMIIEYRYARDIDVQFKDGTIVKNRTFGCFQKGEIANPSIKAKRNMTSLSSNKKI